jgi:hypothetical protein
MTLVTASNLAKKTKCSHLPLPTCGAMASASGQGVFLKNLSVNLVQLKTKQKNSITPKHEGPNPHILLMGTQGQRGEDVTETEP